MLGESRSLWCNGSPARGLVRALEPGGCCSGSQQLGSSGGLGRSGAGAALQLLSSSEGGVVPAEGVLLASTDIFNEDPLVNAGGFLPCEMPAQQFSAPHLRSKATVEWDLGSVFLFLLRGPENLKRNSI